MHCNDVVKTKMKLKLCMVKLGNEGYLFVVMRQSIPVVSANLSETFAPTVNSAKMDTFGTLSRYIQ